MANQGRRASGSQVSAAKRGRPIKGTNKRAIMLSARVEPWVVEAIDAARTPGESRADVLTRWAVARQLA